MKILFLSGPYRKDYMRNARCDFVSLSGTQWFPLLLGYAAAFMEDKGYKVKFVDAPAYHLTFRDVENIFSDYKPDFLVMYPGDKSRDTDIEFADSLVEKSGVPAVFVGPYFAIEPRYFMEKSRRVRYGIPGEFEYPLWELVRGEKPETIKNLYYTPEPSAIIENASRPYLTGPELDAFPFVSDFFARHLDFKHYRTPSEPYPFVDIMTGRGCSWGICGFCLWVHTFVKGRVYNARSIENVLEEFSFIDKKLPFIRSVMIQDDTFPETRAREFCEAKLARGIKTAWSCYVRAEFSFETLALMKKAGCLNLHVGFESATNEVLKRISKGLTKERMTEFAHDAQRAGLRIHGDFLIGLPGETRESIRDLIDWACQIRPYTAQFQIFIPFKGTPLYREMSNKTPQDTEAAHEKLSSQDLEHLSKVAYRRFYFSFFYLARVLKNPYTLFLSKLTVIGKAFASMFWRKMNIR
ncbi:MAG: radical SAM protein [Candidatus Omnitrophica bacterium]|nr:radical SAM protein [Candidatus Omnitrophota bacterium]